MARATDPPRRTQREEQIQKKRDSVIPVSFETSTPAFIGTDRLEGAEFLSSLGVERG